MYSWRLKEWWIQRLIAQEFDDLFSLVPFDDVIEFVGIKIDLCLLFLFDLLIHRETEQVKLLFLLFIRQRIVIVLTETSLAIGNSIGLSSLSIILFLNLCGFFPCATPPSLHPLAAAHGLPKCTRVLFYLILECLHELCLVNVLSLFAKINSISR